MDPCSYEKQGGATLNKAIQVKSKNMSTETLED